MTLCVTNHFYGRNAEERIPSLTLTSRSSRGEERGSACLKSWESRRRIPVGRRKEKVTKRPKQAGARILRVSSLFGEKVRKRCAPCGSAGIKVAFCEPLVDFATRLLKPAPPPSRMLGLFLLSLVTKHLHARSIASISMHAGQRHDQSRTHPLLSQCQPSTITLWCAA